MTEREQRCQHRYLVPARSIALAGCAAGFLRSNFHPAKLYMGDAVSLFLGFVLAVLMLKLRANRPTRVPVAVILARGERHPSFRATNSRPAAWVPPHALRPIWRRHWGEKTYGAGISPTHRESVTTLVHGYYVVAGPVGPVPPRAHRLHLVEKGVPSVGARHKMLPRRTSSVTLAH